MSKVQTSPELIGKYLNFRGYSDITPVGKIIGLTGKTILLVQRITFELDPEFKPHYEPGGFSAICTNQSDQKWIFTETEEVVKIRFSKALLRSHTVDPHPRRFYDYNF